MTTDCTHGIVHQGPRLVCEICEAESQQRQQDAMWNAAIEAAAIQAIVLCANEGATCKGCGFHDLAQNIRALKREAK